MAEETPETASDEPEFVTERWVYLGPHGGSASHVWRDPSEQKLVYDKLKARIFGGIYSVQVRRQDDSVRVLRDVTWTGERAEDAAAIEVQARKTEVMNARIRLEKNSSRHATIDEAIEPLIEIAANLISTTDRAALAEYVTSKIHAARRKR